MGRSSQRSSVSEFAANSLQVDRHAQLDQPAQDFHDRRDRVAFGRAGRASQMRPTAQNLTDQPSARAARADLEENADSIFVGLFDQSRKIDGVRSLSGDGRGRGLAVDVITLTSDPAVERDSIWRDGLDVMKCPVLVLRQPGRSSNGPC